MDPAPGDAQFRPPADPKKGEPAAAPTKGSEPVETPQPTKAKPAAKKKRRGWLAELDRQVFGSSDDDEDDDDDDEDEDDLDDDDDDEDEDE